MQSKTHSSDTPSGSDIYRESFRIIREEADLTRFAADIERVAVRMIHACGDTTIASEIAFSPGVVAACTSALRGGAAILCDSSMTATGIISSRLPANNEVICHIKDPRLTQLAAELGCTKTAAAVDLWCREGLIGGAVIAVGNAPTALFRLLDLLADGAQPPAAIIGIPVGFVGAAESKEALATGSHGVEYLTVRGRRGGSAMTVSAINAIASTDELTNQHSH